MTEIFLFDEGVGLLVVRESSGGGSEQNEFYA